MKRLLFIILLISIFTLSLNAQPETGETKYTAFVYDKPEMFANKLLKLPQYKTVKILEVVDDTYVKVKSDTTVGYLKIADLENQRQVERHLFLKNNQNISSEFRKAIQFGQVKIGMTKEMVKLSKGEPSDINRTRNEYGTSEQWVYGSLGNRYYIYFEDGVVTSIQD